MNMKELLKQHAYFCCVSWLLLVGVLKVLNQYCELGVKDIFILFLPFLWVIFLRSFDQNKKNLLPYAMIVFIAIILFIVVQVTEYPLLVEAKKYFIWLGNVLGGQKKESFPYSLITICFFQIIVSIPCYILLKRYTLRLAVAVVLIIALILVTITDQEISKLSVCFFLTFILLSVMEWRINVFYQSFQKKSISVMTFLLPFALLMTIVLLILPAKKEPIQWKFFKNCWKSITNMVEGWGTSLDLWIHPEKAEFGLNFIGYTEDGMLGGSLEDGNGLAMTVEFSSALTSDIYLIGNAKNEFNGKEWTFETSNASFLDVKDEFEYDLFEMAYALQREGITTETYRDYYRITSFYITYQGIATKALFYPNKIQMVELRSSNDTFQSKTENLRFHGAKDKGTRYRVNYAKLNLGSEYLNQLIINQEKYTYREDKLFHQDEFKSYLKQVNILNNPNIPNNFEYLLYQRANYIRDNYTHIYNELPQRVYDLANELTKDYENDYDKLLALERYLSSFTYTTKPRQPEKGQDLINFMLFESREGYCTYYATAFAIMARCIGIPTRYVQGFCVENDGYREGYNYSVSNRNAHAWAEAYIEGVGWLPFEPTPTYADKRYQPWTKTIEPVVSQYIPTPPIYQGGEYDHERIEQIRELQQKERKLAYQSVIVIIVIVILLILFAIPIYLLSKQAYRNKVYKKASINEKVYLDVLYLLSVFRYCDRRLKPYETLSSYLSYIRTRYPNQAKNLIYLEQIFLRLRYNEEQISQEEHEKIVQIRQHILREVEGILKKSKYLRMRIYLIQAGRNMEL